MNEKTPPSLLRALGPVATVAVFVGSVVGSGIFLVPNTIAGQIPGFLAIVLVWTVAGLLSWAGALSYAELGGMIPDAGGQYAYLREAYGRFPAFLFGWTEFLVVKAGSIAAVAVAFAMYVGYFVPQDLRTAYHATVYPLGVAIPEIGVKLVAMACIVLLSAVNAAGVRAGGWVQNVFTFLKVGALLGLVIAIFAFAKPPADVFRPLWPGAGGSDLFRAFGLAMVAALWSYDGWNNTTYMAGEVIDPKKNVPLALAAGSVIVLGLYLAANAAYAYALPIRDIAASRLVAADAARVFMGSFGGGVISAAVLVSTFGTVNGMVLSGPRVTYAMARDGVFFSRLADVHPRFRTPHVSILVQAVWACLLTLSGRFDQLFTYVIFAAWIFYGLTASAVFVLRRKRPDAARPVRTWGYPVVPAAFILVAAAFVINTLVSDPRDSLMGLCIVCLGLPVYFILMAREKKGVRER
ncbi:MAG: amino acid permease [bacterium]|nr:amino acid permease [bacterium]